MVSSKNQNNLKKPRISNKTLDKKADSNLVSILKQSFNQLEAENKKLKRELDEESKNWRELKEENKNLKAQNAELEDTMQHMMKEAWKLKELVDKLREAIEEPVELKDK